MRRWFADASFRSILRNASYLLSGKIGGALLALTALAFAGRALSPELFGTLGIIEAYAVGVSSLVKFQTWQLIVRYGAPALARKDIDNFRDITGFSFGLDLVSSVVGVVAGMILLPFVGQWVGIRSSDLSLALVYCTLIPLMTSATPTGILRTLDKFGHIATQQLVTPLLRVAGAAISFFCDLGFAGFVITWYIAQLVSGLMLWFYAVRELHRENIHGALRPGLWAPARRIKGAWNFVWTTNITHSIGSVWNPVSEVIVGGMLGPAAAGIFKIALTFFNAAGNPAKLLNKSFYPEIMRLDPASKHPWKLAIRSGVMAGGLSLIILLLVLVGGKPLVTLAFGEKYEDAFGLLRIMTVSLFISMVTFPLKSLLYMAGRHRAALVAEGGAMLGYGILLVALIHQFGLIGAGMAYVGGRFMRALFSLIPTVSAYNKRHSLSHPGDATQ